MSVSNRLLTQNRLFHLFLDCYIGALIVTCVGIPWILLLMLPLGFIYINIQHFYRCTSRELKRLSTMTLSPIYSHLNETLSGLVTIRASQASLRFQRENMDMIEDNMKTQFTSQAAGQWLNVRLQLIGVAMVTGVGIFAVVQHHVHTVDPGLVGLAISYALSLTTILSGTVTAFVETEKEMISVESINQYMERVQPESGRTSRTAPDALWPSQGVVTFADVSLKYREHLPFALRFISFETRPAEKIGIVGRTGSGKSSLFQALFRLVDTCAGDILIDGVSIRSLGLQDLRLLIHLVILDELIIIFFVICRSKIAIIPQQPFLFNGTIRDNLDPTRRYTDGEIWAALQRCHMAGAVNRWGGLSADVLSGNLLSNGKKQLICLARALLLNAKIICIDEATASVDLEMDRLIQQTIRAAFRMSTVLTIAHRIVTIMDSDRIMVLSSGQIVEWDTPNKLLENPASHFYKLVNYLK